MIPDLVYCADGNRRFAEIAIAHGYRYGTQLPHRGLHYPIWFADQNWKKPDRGRYIDALAEHKPHMATVLDLEQWHQLDEVLSWAEEAARYVAVVLIIPKAFGIISELPRHIGSAEVRLGYSVPTKFGGTELPVWEFFGWPVHLLGGQPHQQMKLAHYMDVHSADSNYHHLMATRYNEFWMKGSWHELSAYGDHMRHDAIYRAFERSCANIMEAWSALVTSSLQGMR